jgi:D-3-phosphoglycerate dehydrogenase
MKVLFLGQTAILEPSYGHFLAGVAGRYPVALYDPGRSMAEQFAGVDVVVDQGGSVGTREMIDAGIEAGVKLWQVFGTGVDHVDVAYFLERGLPLANTPGQFSSVALAEHALFLMLYFAKHFPASQASMRAGVFYQPVNDELEGATLGLLGFGASGRDLAKRAAPFGMRILAVDRVAPPPDLAAALRVTFLGGPSALDQLAAEADYLSVHVPLIASTRHMIDARVLGLMKPSAVLINVARGPIVDEVALVEALAADRIRGAGLDAYAREPLPLDSPLRGLPNAVLTPHVAGVTDGTFRRRGEAAAENIRLVDEGLEPLYLIRSVD